LNPILNSGSKLLPNAFRRLLQLLPRRVRDVPEMRQLLPLIPWNNVKVQMENLLSRRVPVLLDYGDARLIDW